jgi:uncharacterized protein YbjT (DUF2867 family)
MSPIAITGTLGHIGSHVVSGLVKAGVPVRVLVRREGEVNLGLSVEVVRGTYEDEETCRRLLKGASKAFFLTSGPSVPRFDGLLAAAARAGGVEHIVKVSILGASHESSELGQWHRGGEERVEASGVPWTFLRPSPFSSNALRWLPTLHAKGTAFGAFGTAPLAMIDPEDIADVAVLALTTSGHGGRIYDLTGPKALTAAEQVSILGEVVGKPFKYVDLPDDAYHRGMTDSGMPKIAADAMLHRVQEMRTAGGVPPNGVVEKLLGRPGRTFRQWVESNAAAFK